MAEENENENESELEENIPEVSDELEDAAAESDPENEGEDAGDESAQLEVEEEEPGEPVDCPPCKSGSPAWMATFADMATLLMAFFVLILSFAHVNVPKYKEVSGSMRSRFGVQTTVPIVEAPTAHNMVMTQYRQAVTEVTAANVIEEQLVREEQDMEAELDVDIGPGESDTNLTEEEVVQEFRDEIAEGKATVTVEDGSVVVNALNTVQEDLEPGQLSQDTIQLLSKVAEVQREQNLLIQVSGEQFISPADTQVNNPVPGPASVRNQDQFEQIKANLSDEISNGLAEVFRGENGEIIIRLTERGSFLSGSASLQSGFEELLNNVGFSIRGATGMIQIQGHTDNVGMAFGNRYRDNWDLSSARAATVADYILGRGFIDSGNVVVKGLADTQPIASNDSATGRSQNRRIEIALMPN